MKALLLIGGLATRLLPLSKSLPKSLLDRGIMGTFHHISDKHLDRYCNEFSFRWNHRKVGDGKRTSSAVRGFDGKRLEYRTLIGRA